MAERSPMLPGGDVLGDRDAIVAGLARCEVLAAAARADLESLAGLLTPFAARAGTVLVRRGDVAGHFLLLTSGRALVAFGEQGAQKVTAVPEGSILGELALLRGTRRPATVTAVTETRGLMGGRAGVVHGYAAVPDPGKCGITPGTAAALAAVMDELNIRL